MKQKTNNELMPAVMVFQNRYDLISYAPDEAVGKVVKALLEINSGGEVPTFEKNTFEGMIFNCLYNDYKNDYQYYLEQHQKKVDAGKQGGIASAKVRWGDNDNCIQS